MNFSDRFVRHLPPFLKREMPPYPVTDELVRIAAAAGAGIEELQEDVRVLRARGAAKRFAAEFATYYASETRKDDVARLALSMLLSKRSNETWLQFEERVRAFLGAEVWDGSKQKHTVTGDVAEWGCYTGVKRELERTGLVVDEMYGSLEDPLRWRLLTVATMGPARDLNFSEIYDVGSAYPPGQRLTKIYSLGGGMWILWVKLTNPGVVAYTEDEVREIVKLTKPAWVRGMVWFPGASNWEVVD
jgi:hypothetical protein